MKKIKPRKEKPDAEREYRVDAWERFEQAVDAALHTPAPHKPAAKPRIRRGRASRHQS